MDIHEINNNLKSQLASSSRAIQKEKGFKQVFSQKLAEMNPANPQGPLDCKENILEKSEGVLSLLEEYARELSDPGTSLGDIEPLVERINEEMSLVEAEASEKGLSDSGLGRLIRELAVTANVAVFKFHRGDYM